MGQNGIGVQHFAVQAGDHCAQKYIHCQLALCIPEIAVHSCHTLLPIM